MFLPGILLAILEITANNPKIALRRINYSDAGADNRARPRDYRRYLALIR